MMEADAKALGSKIVETIKDDGYSASKNEHILRGDFGRFLARGDKGEYRGKTLFAERQDRISRLGFSETIALFVRLLKAGVKIRLIGENLTIKDTKDLDESGKAFQTTMRACADQEFSIKLSDRVSRAWVRKKDAALASGTPFGKSLPVWLTIEGQLKMRDRIVDYGKIVEVTEQTPFDPQFPKRIPASTVKKMFTLAAQGVGSKNILQQLNEKVLSRSWVIRTLNNRAVLGEFKPIGRDVIQGYYPQIVSQSEFDAARAQIKTKRRNGVYAGGNRQKSDTADNLFTGLLFDITTDPVRTMTFQDSRGLHYVMSAFDKGGRPSNRIRYDKLEKAFLGFLETVEWLAIAGESESDEFKGAMAALEAKLRLKDAISREITTNREAMQGEDVDTRRQFMRENAKHEAVLATLTHDIEALQASVQEAQAKSAGLSETKTFQELLTQLRSNPSLRLPARAAIQKKVSRIELVFMPDRQGVVAFIQYTNGAPDATVIHNRDIDENAPWAATMPAALRSSGHFRIQRIRNKPLEYHERLKADVLKWVHSFADMEEAA
jgi:hypothetical protein